MSNASFENILAPYLTVQEIANDGSAIPAHPAADYRRLFLGEDGALHLMDSAGTVTDVATSGGMTRTQLGTTSIGATGYRGTRKVYMKKVTLASDGFLASISAAVKGNAVNGVALAAAVMSDNAGTPLSVIATSGPIEKESDNSALTNLGLSATGRFLTVAIGRWLAAGDYWLCVLLYAAADSRIQIAYAAAGGDWTQVAATFCDQSFIAAASTTDDYSIYADFLT